MWGPKSTLNADSIYKTYLAHIQVPRLDAGLDVDDHELAYPPQGFVRDLYNNEPTTIV